MTEPRNPRAPPGPRLLAVSFLLLLLLYALVAAAALRPLLLSLCSRLAAGRWLAVSCSPLIYGGVLGALAVGVAAAAAAPAALMAWITVLVLMTVAGSPRRRVVEEGGKITVDVAGAAFRAVVREGNALAVACAAVGLFAALKWSSPLEEA